jgi:predicted nucleic acid-binding protein
MRFVDTNVLLYAASRAPEESAKNRIALQILDSDDLALSVQVLQEFYVQATRESKSGHLTHNQAVLLIESFLRYPVLEITLALMQAAMETNRRFHISYWDAAIIEAARSLGCTEILSEDLSGGRRYEGILVRNPFGRSG